MTNTQNDKDYTVDELDLDMTIKQFQEELISNLYKLCLAQADTIDNRDSFSDILDEREELEKLTLDMELLHELRAAQVKLVARRNGGVK